MQLHWKEWRCHSIIEVEELWGRDRKEDLCSASVMIHLQQDIIPIVTSVDLHGVDRHSPKNFELSWDGQSYVVFQGWESVGTICKLWRKPSWEILFGHIFVLAEMKIGSTSRITSVCNHQFHSDGWKVVVGRNLCVLYTLGDPEIDNQIWKWKERREVQMAFQGLTDEEEFLEIVKDSQGRTNRYSHAYRSLIIALAQKFDAFQSHNKWELRIIWEHRFEEKWIDKITFEHCPSTLPLILVWRNSNEERGVGINTKLKGA